jgi:glycogen phosphorylase
MRVLVDEENVEWDEAWHITQATLAYTNHTLMPEALERWPVALLEHVLPRHMQIIHEINSRFLEEMVARFPDDPARLARMSLVEEGREPMVRMAHLAMIGSHSVNGVAALHSVLVKATFARDFAEAWPDRFNNKTNGVTQRRWLVKANPALAHFISERIGEGWISDLEQVVRLEAFADDEASLAALARIKQANKQRLADLAERLTGVSLDPRSLFDVQAKRMHEYKRQLLNALSVIDLYLRIVEDGARPSGSRAAIFAGKAAPGYRTAKLIIRLINGIAARCNTDPRAVKHLQVTLLPDYRVSLAECIIPAADLSEQISTAGFEASGTGNMKFAMNGALTIGTLDGANVEIRDQVGEENIYIFGLKADEVSRLAGDGTHRAREVYEADARVRRVVDALRGPLFSPGEPGLFEPLVGALLDGNDRYFLLADFADYVRTKDRAAADYEDDMSWARKALLNIARMGPFSSDRTIRQYAAEIWDVHSVP